MNLIQENPSLRGFSQHGVIFNKVVNDNRAIGICPFCNKPGKFDVALKTQIWGCKRCGISGNFETFLGHCAEMYIKALPGEPSIRIAKNRNLRPQTLESWGVGWTGEFYSIPVSGNPSRRVSDIHRYYLGAKNLSTSGGKKTFLVPMNLFGSRKIWVTEGEWDAMALWECLKKAKIKEDVYGVPGAGSFPSKLTEMLHDKEVVVIFDNDDAGVRGGERIYKLLEGLVRSCKFLTWPTG